MLGRLHVREEMFSLERAKERPFQGQERVPYARKSESFDALFSLAAENRRYLRYPRLRVIFLPGRGAVGTVFTEGADWRRQIWGLDLDDRDYIITFSPCHGISSHHLIITAPFWSSRPPRK